MTRPIFSSQIASSTPFDPTTGHGFSSTDVQAALEELRLHTVYDSDTAPATTNGNYIMDNTHANLHFVTGSATNFSVWLPDARTIPVASYYQVANLTNQIIYVKDAAGTTLVQVGANSIAYCYLQINGTLAGTWVFFQVLAAGIASGVVSYNVTSSTPFSTSSTTDVIITGMTVTPQQGTYGIWFNSDAQCTQNNATVYHSIYKNGVVIGDSIRRTQSVSANFIFQQSALTIVQLNGTESVDVRVRTNQGTLTVNGRSLALIRFGA